MPVDALHLEYPGGSLIVTDGAQMVTVGRDDSCDITVAVASVSATHAVLEHRDGAWWYQDRSSYGSYVNGLQVTTVRITGEVTIRLADPEDGPEFLVSIAPRPAGHSLPRPNPGSRLESRPASKTIKIGRSTSNDIVIADDLTVSRHHATFSLTTSGYEIVDLDSGAGTFVNGRRVERAAVTDDDIVGIGRHVFALRGGQLEHFVDDRAVLAAVKLGVTVEGGAELLKDVTFSAEPGQLIAVVGPSGAGKSTLLRSLVGTLKPTAGNVTYNGRDVHDSFDELRGRIGFVPQDDILHVELTSRQALDYAAELRFSDETTADERDARVTTVLDELGLGERANLPISRLSGGQRKRASVALELLTEPALLFLDEPTSGLDPGLERSVMELLADLAKAGRTVLVITHAVTSLGLCDRVLVLAPGGRVAYFGPPDELLVTIGVDDYPDVFRALESSPDETVERWTRSDAFHRFVGSRVDEQSHRPTRAEQPTASVGPQSQWKTLAQRYVAVIRANRSTALLLCAQAPLLALIIIVAQGTNAVGEGKQRSLLMIVMLAAIAIGLVNSSREIVRELPILRRERLIGLSIRAYLLSKIVVLGALSAIESLVLVLMVFGLQSDAPTSLVAPWAIEITVLVFLIMLTSACAGLAVSAMVRSDTAALILVPVLLIAQLVMSHALVDVERSAVLRFGALLSPSYWGFAALASSTNLKELEVACDGLVSPCSSLWSHDVGSLALAILALLVLASAFVLIAAAGVRRNSA